MLVTSQIIYQRYLPLLIFVMSIGFTSNAQSRFSKLKGCGFSVQKEGATEMLKQAKSKIALEKNHKITIPIIFHVIYKNEEENISREAIQKEIAELNMDFQMMNVDTSIIYPSYKILKGNPVINFVLADTLFPGSRDKGIKRVKRTSSGDLYKSDPVIMPSKYMNVYSGKISSDGFTYSYAWKSPATDAIYLYYEWVGGSYRLLTHETGHWLGLYHTFEDGCDVSNDEIADTPPQKRETGLGAGCNPASTRTRCAGQSLPMYNNFMDYSDCRVMFTKEQASVIRQNILVYRPKLLQLK